MESCLLAKGSCVATPQCHISLRVVDWGEKATSTLDEGIILIKVLLPSLASSGKLHA